MVNWLWRRVGEVLLPQPHVDLIFAVVLQQHLRCGVSGWKGGGVLVINQLPQFFFILWQLPGENYNQG